MALMGVWKRHKDSHGIAAMGVFKRMNYDAIT